MGVKNWGLVFCHAGGREFESRRSRHHIIKGSQEIVSPFFVGLKIDFTPYFTPSGLKSPIFRNLDSFDVEPELTVSTK